MDTVIVSDLHLSDADTGRTDKPFWKAYKRKEHFFDDDLVRMIRHVEEESRGPVEIIFNGDVFDFDNVVALPADPPKKISWLARWRGLGSEEWMSVFKVERILNDHERLFRFLGSCVERGNRLVFVHGNHDLELAWDSVRAKILEALEVGDPSVLDEGVRFCDWFYVSQKDTFISHGHLYDPFCAVRHVIEPMIRLRPNGPKLVRLGFGDLSERYILNGMGYFNPHASSNYIMSAVEYFKFFWKYMAKTQPLLLFTWLSGSLVTFYVTMRHHLAPRIRDPLGIEERVGDIAQASQVEPRVVRQLHEVNVAPAASNPYRILRELWLDRALLLLAAFYVASQVFLTVNIVLPASIWWFLIPLCLLLPFFTAYAVGVKSQVFQGPMISQDVAHTIQAITGCNRLAFGHNHEPEHSRIGDVEYVNSGFWSPAYREPECINRIGTQTFIWLRGSQKETGERQAELWEWPMHESSPKRYSQ